MKVSRKDLISAIEILQSADDIHTVSYFCGDLIDIKQRIRLTRRYYKRPYGYFDKTSYEFVVSIGRPNFKEREFIKLCKKAKAKPKRYLLKRI